LIKRFQVDDKSETFYVNFIANGVYIAQFKTDNSQISRKIIIQK